MKRIVVRGSLILAVLTILAAMAGWLALRATQPRASGRLAALLVSVPRRALCAGSRGCYTTPMMTLAILR